MTHGQRESPRLRLTEPGTDVPRQVVRDKDVHFNSDTTASDICNRFLSRPDYGAEAAFGCLCKQFSGISRDDLRDAFVDAIPQLIDWVNKKLSDGATLSDRAIFCGFINIAKRIALRAAKRLRRWAIRTIDEALEAEFAVWPDLTQMENREMVELIHAALVVLNDNELQVFTNSDLAPLSGGTSLPNAEMAKVLGITEHAVRALLQRARDKIRGACDHAV